MTTKPVKRKTTPEDKLIVCAMRTSGATTTEISNKTGLNTGVISRILKDAENKSLKDRIEELKALPPVEGGTVLDQDFASSAKSMRQKLVANPKLMRDPEAFMLLKTLTETYRSQAENL